MAAQNYSNNAPPISLASASPSFAQPQQAQPALPTSPVGGVPPTKGGGVSLLAPPTISQPIGANGEVIFSEYQARVFNRTEALYKTNGYLSVALFEDSYLLSKATATYVINSVPVTGTQADVASLALSTYRGVLGIAVPPPAAVPPTTSPIAAVTPTRFTPPTATVTSVPQIPTTIAIAPTPTPTGNMFSGYTNPYANFTASNPFNLFSNFNFPSMGLGSGNQVS